MGVNILSPQAARVFLRRCHAHASLFEGMNIPGEPGSLFLEEENGNPRGWMLAASVHGKPGRVCFSSIWVEPDCRNQGIATSLLQHGVRWAIEHECEALELWVRENSSHARRIYQRLGFRESGWIRSSDNPDEPLCLHMILPLSAPLPVAA